MELKVRFVESSEEFTTSFDDVQEVLVVDDTSIGKYPWSSKNTVDKLCPAFEESGRFVQCEPIEGYPLKVVTELPESEVNGITLTILQGKNLFDCTQYEFVDKMVVHSSGLVSNSSGYSAVINHIPIRDLCGATITINHPPTEKLAGTSAGLAFYDADMNYISGSNGYTHVVPDNAEYFRFSVPREWANGTNGTKEDIQIELGSEVTEFMPYKGETKYTVEFQEPVHGGSYEWSGVKATAGINTIWSSVGATSVEGKSDPVAFIEKLTNAVLSLGGNI